MDNPVAWMVTYGGLTNIVYTQPTQVVDTHYQPLYAAPPQRTWVSLTDDEIKAIIGHNHPEGIGSYARELFKQIEAKLREKNCG